MITVCSYLRNFINVTLTGNALFSEYTSTWRYFLYFKPYRDYGPHLTN